jgi:DNA replication ATP-dependent helicase Dna2
VSFTRARSKLIIFGSRRTLQTTPLLKEFFILMDEKGWVMNMREEAHTTHLHALRGITPENIDTEIDADFCSELKVTPSKRNIDEKENESDEATKDQRPKKQMKNSHGIDSGILKGKPLLQDVINEGL